MANGPVISQPRDGDAGWWTFATTLPIAPVDASVCAGPFSGPAFTCQRHPHLPLPVTVNALPPAAVLLESAVSPELVRQPLAYYEHSLGAAYPYGKPLTTYISRTALEEIHPGTTPWAPAVSQALPDHAYASDAAKIRRLEKLIGRPAVLDGLNELLRRHAHGCATTDDLVRYWSRASGSNLRSWATQTLRPATT